MFVELGLVVELQDGDEAIFKSSELTHFNLHFEGFRSSIVFHTDKAAEAWIDTRNGWTSNKYFRSS